jgi:HAD superfamily hydrolase (TIGR01509 family)
VIYDLDGVLLDSEAVWDSARRTVVADAGGQWQPGATRAMMGMSSPEWSAYLRRELGVDRDPAEITRDVVALVMDSYEHALPLLPGAVETVRDLATTWPLGLASSSNRPVIERFLDRSGLRSCFVATVSSEEVARGKPAPDVYLEAAGRMGVSARDAVAIEDSTNGIWSAVAAGLAVVAVPNREFPPTQDALEAASLVVDGLAEVTIELVEGQVAPP